MTRFKPFSWAQSTSPDFFGRNGSAYKMLAFARAAGVSACVAALLIPVQPAAQVLEEIIVTAQKREQAINDVGIAVIAFSGEQIDELGFENSVDIIRMSPAVHYTSGAAGRHLKFTMRGVTQFDFFEGVEGPIAVYIDDTYITSAQAQVFGLFDVERVEVLKGPQGTLFGRNATGGLVHYMSRKPGLDRSGGYADLTYGRFNQVRAEAAVNSVLSDTTAIRGSVLYNRYDHTIDNRYPEGAKTLSPSPTAQPDLGSDDTWAARLHLLHATSDEVEFLLTGFHYRSEPGAAPYESDSIIAERDEQGRHINTYFASPTETREQIGPGGVSLPISFLDGEVPGFTEDGLRPVPGGDLFGYLDDDLGDFEGTHDYAPEDAIRLQTSGVTGKLSWALSDRIKLTSITDYKRYANRNSLNVGGIPASHFLFLTDSQSESIAQELRLNGDTDKASWTAGLYYLHIDNDTDTGLGFPGDSILTFSPPPFGLDPNPFDATPGPGTDFVNETSLTTDSTSVFGQIDYDLSSSITLIAGLRVVFEDKEFNLAQNAYEDTDPTRLNTEIFGFVIPQPPGSNPFEDDTSETLWTGKVQLDFRPSDDTLIYAGVNRGVKAGSFNAPLADGSSIQPSEIGYDQEKLLAYEVGLKQTMFSGTTQVNASAYYYDYTDYQAFTFVNASGFVTNEDATIKGVEFELMSSPVEGLDLLLSAAFLDTKVMDLQFAPGLFKDVKSTFTPETQIVGLIRYQWPVLGGTVAIQFDGTYKSSFFTNLRNFEAHEVDSHAIGNLRLFWKDSTEQWEGSFYVTNLWDERYQDERFDLSTLCGCDNVHFGRQRWYGVSARRKF